MNKGLRFEYDTVKEIDESTNDRTRIACGGGSSGNITTDQTDLVIMRQRSGMEVNVYAVEMKRTGADKHFYIDAEDLEQLWKYARPEWITPVLVVKFNNRQAVVIDMDSYVEFATGELHSISHDADGIEVACHAADCCPSEFEPFVTSKGSLRVTKPSTDEWPSTQKGLSTGDLLIQEFDL